MALIEDIERRLLNWARWRHGAGAGGMGFASVNMASEGIRDGYREATVPTNDCEAELTGRAVLALAGELRRTVEVIYLEGGTVEQKARRLVCSRAAVFDRRDRAHVCIQRWLAEWSAGQRQQRDRVEALQKAARP